MLQSRHRAQLDSLAQTDFESPGAFPSLTQSVIVMSSAFRSLELGNAQRHRRFPFLYQETFQWPLVPVL